MEKLSTYRGQPGVFAKRSISLAVFVSFVFQQTVAFAQFPSRPITPTEKKNIGQWLTQSPSPETKVDQLDPSVSAYAKVQQVGESCVSSIHSREVPSRSAPYETMMKSTYVEPDQVTLIPTDELNRLVEEVRKRKDYYTVLKNVAGLASKNHQRQTVFNWKRLRHQFQNSDLLPSGSFKNFPTVQEVESVWSVLPVPAKIGSKKSSTDQLEFFNSLISKVNKTCRDSYKVYQEMSSAYQDSSKWNPAFYPRITELLGTSTSKVLSGDVQSRLRERIRQLRALAASEGGMTVATLGLTPVGKMFQTETDLQAKVGVWNELDCVNHGQKLAKLTPEQLSSVLPSSITQLEQTYEGALSDNVSDSTRKNPEVLLKDYIQKSPYAIVGALKSPEDALAICGLVKDIQSNDAANEMWLSAFAALTMPLGGAGIIMKGVFAGAVIALAVNGYYFLSMFDLHVSYRMERALNQSIASGLIDANKAQMTIENIRSSRPFSYANLVLSGIGTAAAAARIGPLSKLAAKNKQFNMESTPSSGRMPGSNVLMEMTAEERTSLAKALINPNGKGSNGMGFEPIAGGGSGKPWLMPNKPVGSSPTQTLSKTPVAPPFKGQFSSPSKSTVNNSLSVPTLTTRQVLPGPNLQIASVPLQIIKNVPVDDSNKNSGSSIGGTPPGRGHRAGLQNTDDPDNVDRYIKKLDERSPSTWKLVKEVLDNKHMTLTIQHTQALEYAKKICEEQKGEKPSDLCKQIQDRLHAMASASTTVRRIEDPESGYGLIVRSDGVIEGVYSTDNALNTRTVNGTPMVQPVVQTDDSLAIGRSLFGQNFRIVKRDEGFFIFTDDHKVYLIDKYGRMVQGQMQNIPGNRVMFFRFQAATVPARPGQTSGIHIHVPAQNVRVYVDQILPDIDLPATRAANSLPTTTPIASNQNNRTTTNNRATEDDTKPDEIKTEIEVTPPQPPELSEEEIILEIEKLSANETFIDDDLLNKLTHAQVEEIIKKLSIQKQHIDPKLIAYIRPSLADLVAELSRNLENIAPELIAQLTRDELFAVVQILVNRYHHINTSLVAALDTDAAAHFIVELAQSDQAIDDMFYQHIDTSTAANIAIRLSSSSTFIPTHILHMIDAVAVVRALALGGHIITDQLFHSISQSDLENLAVELAVASQSIDSAIIARINVNEVVIRLARHGNYIPDELFYRASDFIFTDLALELSRSFMSIDSRILSRINVNEVIRQLAFGHDNISDDLLSRADYDSLVSLVREMKRSGIVISYQLSQYDQSDDPTWPW